nr:PREDICTED: uncharacterized protein DKFZp434B061-like [Paralichthys olivaceus]
MGQLAYIHFHCIWAVTASTRWTPTDRRPTPSSTTTSATPPTTTLGAASRRVYPGRRPTATPSLSRVTRTTAPRPRCLLYLRCHPSSVHLAPSLSRPRVSPRASPRVSPMVSHRASPSASPRAKAVCLGQKVAGLPPPPSRAPTPPASTAPSTGPRAV